MAKLFRTGRSNGGRIKAISLLALGVGGIALTAVAARNYGRRRRTGSHDDAPEAARRGFHRHFHRKRTVGKTITINRPRGELYAFWRDFGNLPRFMENVRAVKQEEQSGRSTWTIEAPAGGTVDIETEIVEERENEIIAWRSVKGSEIRTEGHVAFRDAPGGRGTLVEAIICYRPPLGMAGALIAAMFRREPEVQARQELKRFKMLMETGEIAHANNQEH